MPRWFGMLLLLPVGMGCLAFAYPTMSRTPELIVENPDGTANAFRVDIDKTGGTPYACSKYTLSSIPIDSHGLIPSQFKVAPASDVFYPPTAEGNWHERCNYTMLVRVYRPGYQTIEVTDWQKSRELQWIAAPDLAAQLKAIEDLVADPDGPRTTWDDGKMRWWWKTKGRVYTPLGIQAGSVSPSHRKALEFAASEYQRLANSPAASAPGEKYAWGELQSKAEWYRTYAAQKAE